MTEQQQKQAKALKELLDAGAIEAMDRERGFIVQLDHRARNNWHYGLTDGMASWLRSIVWKNREELSAAGKGELIFTEGKK